MMDHALINKIENLSSEVNEKIGNLENTLRKFDKINEELMNKDCPVQVGDILKSETAGVYAIVTYVHLSKSYLSKGKMDFDNIHWRVGAKKIKKNGDRLSNYGYSMNFKALTTGDIYIRTRKNWWRADNNSPKYFVYDRPEATNES